MLLARSRETLLYVFPRANHVTVDAVPVDTVLLADGGVDLGGASAPGHEQLDLLDAFFEFVVGRLEAVGALGDVLGVVVGFRFRGVVLHSRLSTTHPTNSPNWKKTLARPSKTEGSMGRWYPARLSSFSTISAGVVPESSFHDMAILRRTVPT